eukprot:Seg2631.4 transcript_id=Seg2631.4/GoldUCD/mRNA.D3Y31 product="hypothetical protein" protein_id=Seg2631.4/GoldUCD/D3Y31
MAEAANSCSAVVCGICYSKLCKKSDYNLLSGKNDYNKDLRELPVGLRLLLRIRELSLKYLCKGCLALLNQRRFHQQKVKELTENLVKKSEAGLTGDLNCESVDLFYSPEASTTLTGLSSIGSKRQFGVVTSTPKAGKKIVVLSTGASKVNYGAAKSLRFNNNGGQNG